MTDIETLVRNLQGLVDFHTRHKKAALQPYDLVVITQTIDYIQSLPYQYESDDVD